MTFVFEVIIGYIDKIINLQNMINYSIRHYLFDIQTILELFHYFCKTSNEYLSHDHP
jgi:hypothetical protein